MKAKIGLIFIFALLVISISGMASAYFTHQQDTNFSLVVSSNNATSCNLSTIQYPSLPSTIFNLAMERNGQDFNITVEGSNFSNLGDVCMGVTCYDGATFEPGSVCKTITPSGEEVDEAQASIFMIFLLIIFVFLGFSVYGLMKSFEFAWQIFYICTTYLLLFSLFFICWLFANNYLWDTPIIASIFWVIWLTLAILFSPFIILVGAYMLKRQAEELMMNDYMNQGYTKEEAKHMSKKQKRHG